MMKTVPKRWMPQSTPIYRVHNANRRERHLHYKDNDSFLDICSISSTNSTLPMTCRAECHTSHEAHVLNRHSPSLLILLLLFKTNILPLHTFNTLGRSTIIFVHTCAEIDRYDSMFIYQQVYYNYNYVLNRLYLRLVPITVVIGKGFSIINSYIAANKYGVYECIHC